ncbi:hypothetical protein O181_067532 [Austropuccinia psidii MF-1]|uniref:Uncharacterized protein n=1 Tax=Austropuccinia psidii MF-1 TaxID=1389203 RepID=A0A9Q3I5D2_9BASI|nr:hypothetical protein [Austropuccinia psidii MF-1]
MSKLGGEDSRLEVLQAGIDNFKLATGASHTLTGDLSALHSFPRLTSQIPLSVATRQSGRQSFFTGVGCLIYNGLSAHHVSIQGELHCPDATCMLISPAGLKKFGAKLSFINDNIIISDTAYTPVLQALFCNRSNRWLFLPYIVNRFDEMKTDIPRFFVDSTLPKEPYSPILYHIDLMF